MKLEFLGVRGSMPVSGDDRNKYGGYTLCAYIVTSDGEWIIIDAGTGISKLGDIFASQEEEKPQNHHLLLTHFHLDHITGLPFFAPLYSSKATLNFYTTYDQEETEEYLSGLMAGRYFPLEFKETPSKKIFKRIPENNFQIGGADISSIPLNKKSLFLGVDGGAIIFYIDNRYKI